MRLLVKFRVVGIEACPWSVPRVTSHGGAYRPKRSRMNAGSASLADWQAQVRLAAVRAMGGRGPVTGPVQVIYVFTAETPPGHRDGQIWPVSSIWRPETRDGEGRWCKVSERGRKDEPDLTNMVKGTEDAMEGVVFGNDAQVRYFSVAGWYGPLPGVAVSVSEIEPCDFVGEGPER